MDLMDGNTLSRSKFTIEHKWWIAILGGITQTVNAGFCYSGMSVFFPSFVRDFGWSRAAISGAYSFARAEPIFFGYLEGRIVDRVGASRIMYAGILLCVLGYLSLSFVNTRPMLFLAFFAINGLGSNLGYLAPISVVIAKAFPERRGLAFGLVRAGPGLSGLLVPVIGVMIVAWGWRTAARASAGILLAVGLLLAWTINYIYQRYAPEHSSAKVDGDEQSSAPSAVEPQYSCSEVLRTKIFWLFSVAMALRHLVTEAVTFHFVILLVDRGWSTAAASRLLGLSFLISVPARVAIPLVGDILNERGILNMRRSALVLLAALSGSVLLMGLSAQASLFMICMVIYSLAYGGLTSLQEAIRADYFGTKEFASIHGVYRSVTALGSVAGPFLAGVLFDLTKNYATAFTIFAALSLVSMAFMFLAKPAIHARVEVSV